MLFPGAEAALADCIVACTAMGLTVRLLVWDKGHKFGPGGERLNYSTESVVVAYFSKVGRWSSGPYYTFKRFVLLSN